ncbi:MAG: hypothetical protein NT016_00820 [Candidatus Aenigmarchaeota archaeon]|nr:hypothetical protein [Candidatus Aenigmarchaeota archaeon]
MQINLKVYMRGANPFKTVENLYSENTPEMDALGYGFLAGDDEMARVVMKEGCEPYGMANFLMKKLGTAVKVEMDV